MSRGGHRSASLPRSGARYAPPKRRVNALNWKAGALSPNSIRKRRTLTEVSVTAAAAVFATPPLPTGGDDFADGTDLFVRQRRQASYGRPYRGALALAQASPAGGPAKPCRTSICSTRTAIHCAHFRRPCRGLSRRRLGYRGVAGWRRPVNRGLVARHPTGRRAWSSVSRSSPPPGVWGVVRRLVVHRFRPPLSP